MSDYHKRSSCTRFHSKSCEAHTNSRLKDDQKAAKLESFSRCKWGDYTAARLNCGGDTLPIAKDKWVWPQKCTRMAHFFHFFLENKTKIQKKSGTLKKFKSSSSSSSCLFRQL